MCSRPISVIFTWHPDLLPNDSAYEPSVMDMYRSLHTAVERSDLWRYVVMCRHGGVYTDADTLCVRPIQVRCFLLLRQAMSYKHKRMPL
jgi:mannosyltransferase OCH1-like enzyme